MTPTARHRDRRIVAGAVVGMFAVIVALWWLSERANDRAISAEHDQVVAERDARVEAEQKIQALEGLTAATSALQDQCRKGIESACHQLVGLKALPNPSGEGERQDAEVQESEVQEPEVQEAERQEPEVQEGERDDPERQDPEIPDVEIQDPDANDPEQQDSETDDAEQQDEEVQNDEQQDPEIDDPEIQDLEVQDPELDDPDPNSLFNFVALDSCSPPAGEVLVDADINVIRDPETRTITYVLSCKSAPIADLIDLPGNPTLP